MLDCITVETKSNPDACVIWMHGLGADGHDFETIIPELNLAAHLGIRFIFPNAPMRSVTVANGFRMRAWYDIIHADLGNTPDVAGILESSREIEKLVDSEEARGIPSLRIALAGFSQGGVLALQIGPRFPRPLAGVMALSTYSPTALSLAKELSAVNRHLPVFWAHGTADSVVPESLMREGKDAFVNAGFAVEFHNYSRMAHGICPQEIEDMASFLQRIFA
jgi:phospholipase/carboxylesterase